MDFKYLFVLVQILILFGWGAALFLPLKYSIRLNRAYKEKLHIFTLYVYLLIINYAFVRKKE